MKEWLKTWMAKAALPFVKGVAKSLIRKELLKLGGKLSEKLASEGPRAFNELFDGLQAKAEAVVQKSWVRALLPDKLELEVQAKIREGGDEIQVKVLDAISSKSQGAIQNLLVQAADLICEKIDGIKL